MSNEHLEDIAQPTVDPTVNGDGEAELAADDLADGPLDPSVFFGLFDDLSESDKSTPEEADPAPEPGDVDVDGPETGSDSDTAHQPSVDPDPGDVGNDGERSAAPPVDDEDLGGHPPAVTTDPPADPAAAAGSTSEDVSIDGPHGAPTAPPETTGSAGDGGARPTLEPAPAPVPHIGSGPAGGTIATDRVHPGQPQLEPSPSEPPQPEQPQPYSVLFAPARENGAPPGGNGSATSGSKPIEQPRPAGFQTGGTTLLDAPQPDVSAEPEPIGRRAAPAAVPVRTERAGGTLAKLALATIATGLFGGLIVAFVLSLSTPEVEPVIEGTTNVGDSESPAASTVVEELTVDNVVSRLGQATVSADDLNQLMADEMARRLRESRVDITGVTFDSGTTRLSAEGGAVVERLAEAAAGTDSPVTAMVRTYSERTAAENLALSRQQAEALTEALVTAGISPGRVRAVGVGSSPLSPAQPVPDFIAITPGFGDSSLENVLGTGTAFSIGGDPVKPGSPTAWPLRIEGVASLDDLGRTLAVGESAIGLAGYSFFADSDEANRSVAATTAGAVAELLSEGFGVDRARMSVITPGPSPYVPPAEVGNVIWIAAGPQSLPAFEIAAVDTAAITFSGDALSTEAQPSVESLAAALRSSGATVVLDVRSYDGGGRSANLGLSQARANALSTALQEAGVAPEQIRTFAGGSSTYFSADGPWVTVTVVP